MPLPDTRRTQLDGIVNQMISNEESDSNIQLVVNDFVSKYQNESVVLPPKRDLLRKTSDIVSTVFPGKQAGQAIGTLSGLGITKAKESLGVVPKGTTEAFDISVPSPLQVGADVARGALSVAGLKLPIASSILGKTAQFGALGAGGAGASTIAEGGTTEEALASAKKGALIGGVIGGGLGLAEKGLTKLSGLLGKTGDKIQFSVIKPSQADIKDGFSIDTVKKYNLGGSLKSTFEKTDKTLDTLSKQLNQKLESSNASLDLNKVYENTTKRLLGNKLESFGSNAQMEGAIEKLRNEIVAISGENGIVSIPEAQLVKRASGHFGAWSYGVPTPEATASQKVYNIFYNELKTAIEKNSPEGIKSINKEISKLIPIMNALIRRIPVAERNNALSLTDIISLTGATLDPRALSISLLNLASKSGAVGSALSKTPDLGKGLQKIEPIVRSVIAR